MAEIKINPAGYVTFLDVPPHICYKSDTFKPFFESISSIFHVNKYEQSC